MDRRIWASLGLVLGLLVEPAAVRGQGASEVFRVGDCRLSLFEKANLASERSGILDRVSVTEGDRVQAGDAVAFLKDSTIRAALATAEKQAENDIDLRYAKKAVELATLEWTKSVKVNESAMGTIAEIELRRLRLAAEKSLLQVEQAEQQIEVLRLQRDEKRALLTTCAIAAPWSGVVMRVLKRRGEGVREGEAVLEIADLSRLRAEIYVPLSDAWQLEVQQEVRFKLPESSGPQLSEPRVFAGKIVYIEPRVDPVTQKVRVWAEIANQDDLLMDGLQGELFIRQTAIRRTGAMERTRSPVDLRPSLR